MIEGFFFNGVDAEAARAAVSGEDDFSALIRADEAKAALPFLEAAITRTKVALNAAVLQGMPILSWVTGFAHAFIMGLGKLYDKGA